MSEKKQWETRDMTGSAFVNRRKQKDTHPDYTGEIRVNGQLYWLNVWQKQTQSGDAWFSYGVNPKEALPQQTTPPAAPPKPQVQQQPAQTTSDDDIPF